METFFRIQDSRSELPKRSRNYWSNESEHMQGVSAFGDLYTASRDLLGREDVDGLGVVYSDGIETDGGKPVLSVFKGEDCGDESGNVCGFSVAPIRKTERRFTPAQVLAAWKSAINAEFGDNVNGKTWQQIDAEYDLSDLQEVVVLK